MPPGGFGGLARTLGWVATATVFVAGGYLAGNPDARQEAVRIFSGNNRPALAREYAPAKPAAAQAAKQQEISYKELKNEEFRQYQKNVPHGIEISRGIIARNKTYLLGSMKDSKDLLRITGMVFSAQSERLSEIDKIDDFNSWLDLKLNDLNKDGEPEVIVIASPYFVSTPWMQVYVYDGKTDKRLSDLRSNGISVANLDSSPELEFIKHEQVLGPGNNMIEMKTNGRYEKTVYRFIGNRFVEDSQLTAKFKSTEQQLSAIVSSSAPQQQKEQQLKAMADADPQTAYAAMSALYPEMSDYFQVAADVKAGRVTSLEASLYLQSKNGLPLSPEGVLLYGIQRIARSYDEQKKQEVESSAKAAGITSGSQPVYNTSLGAYLVNADGQVYNFSRKEDADKFIKDRINAPRDYRFEKTDPQTGQTSTERFRGTQQEYQREVERRALENANRQAQEKLKTDPFYQGTKKAADDVEKGVKDFEKGVNEFLKGSQSSSGSGSSQPKSDPLGDFLRGLDGKKK